MRTLALRAGARVAVVTEEWCDAFGVVTRGRVQLELRDGEPGPVLGRDAGFWLRGTGVRALRNPGPRRARVRIATPRARQSHANRPAPYASYRIRRTDMNSTNDQGVVADPAPGRTSRPRPLRRLARTGLVATLAAMGATTLAAALARAAGVDFEIPDGGETIPLAGFAVLTGLCSVVGIVMAAALLHWSARPAERFMWTAVPLTAISLIPPLLTGANPATTTALLALHLVPAAVMIPTLTRSLRSRTD